MSEASLSKGALNAAACSNCHAVSGVGMPDISALSSGDLAQALTRYRSETEGTTVMHRLARAYSDADITLIAETLGADLD